MCSCVFAGTWRPEDNFSCHSSDNVYLLKIGIMCGRIHVTCEGQRTTSESPLLSHLSWFWGLHLGHQAINAVTHWAISLVPDHLFVFEKVFLTSLELNKQVRLAGHWAPRIRCLHMPSVCHHSCFMCVCLHVFWEPNSVSTTWAISPVHQIGFYF